MEREKVRLSNQGEAYLKNSHCSNIVSAVLNSIDTFSAEVLSMDDTIVHVQLSEFSLVHDICSQKNFSVHKDHLIVV